MEQSQGGGGEEVWWLAWEANGTHEAATDQGTDPARGKHIAMERLTRPLPHELC